MSIPYRPASGHSPFFAPNFLLDVYQISFPIPWYLSRTPELSSSPLSVGYLSPTQKTHMDSQLSKNISIFARPSFFYPSLPSFNYQIDGVGAFLDSTPSITFACLLFRLPHTPSEMSFPPPTDGSEQSHSVAFFFF